MSSDFGALLLREIARQIGLTARLAAAVRDKRHPSYMDQPLRDLCAQRLYHIASGYADGNDANRLRYDPLLKLSVARAPTQHLARAPTFSRLAHQVRRTDLSRRTQACVDHCIASYPEPAAALVLARDHPADPTYGQQAFTFYNHHYQSYGSLPLLMFEGTSHAFVAAFLRPGKRGPPGAETARSLVRLLASLRRLWPSTPILVRGDRHCATPEVLEVLAHRRHSDFVFGLAGNPVLRRQAAPVMQAARALPAAERSSARVGRAPGPQYPPL